MAKRIKKAGTLPLQLYQDVRSNNSLRAKMFLTIKGVDFELKDVDLFKGGHKAPDFLKINPRGQVPFLVDPNNSFVGVNESVAICQYVEHMYEGKRDMCPSDASSAAENFRVVAEFAQKLDPKNVYGSVRFRKLKMDDLKDKVSALLKEVDYWEQHRLCEPFFCGDDISMADVVVYPLLATWVYGLGLELTEKRPKLAKWLAAVEKEDPESIKAWRGAFFKNQEPEVLSFLGKL